MRRRAAEPPLHPDGRPLRLHPLRMQVRRADRRQDLGLRPQGQGQDLPGAEGSQVDLRGENGDGCRERR